VRSTVIMSNRQLLTDVLSLPADERAAIAGTLIQSLEADLDPDADAGWVRNARSRLGGTRTEDLTTISWSEAFRRVQQAAVRRG